MSSSGSIASPQITQPPAGDISVDESTTESAEVTETSDASGTGGASVKVGRKRGGQDQQGQGNSNTTGEATIEKPDSKASAKRGGTVFEKVARAMFEAAEAIMQRRADRLKVMEELSVKLQELAGSEADKAIEQADKARKKKKSGLFGKIMAVVGLAIAAAVLTAVSFGTLGPVTFGGLALAVGGLAVSSVAAGDTFFNDGKIMDKVMTPMTKATQAIAKGLEKIGLPPQVANGLATALVMLAMVVVAWKAGGVVSKLGSQLGKHAVQGAAGAAKSAQAATKAAKVAQDAGKGTKEAAKAAETASQHAKTAARDAQKSIRAARNLEQKAAKAAEKGADSAGDLAKRADDAAKAAENAYLASKNAKAAANMAAEAADAKGILSQAQEAAKLAQASQKLKNTNPKQAQKLADQAHEMAQKAENTHKNASKYAKVLSDKADDLAAKGDAGADAARKAADDAAEVAESAADVARQAKSEVSSVSPRSLSSKPDDTLEGMLNNLDEVGADKWVKAARIGMVSEQIVNVANQGYSTVIQIINAQLEKLMANDQADIKKLQAIMAVLQQMLEANQQVSDVEAKMAEDIFSAMNKEIQRISRKFTGPYITSRA